MKTIVLFLIYIFYASYSNAQDVTIEARVVDENSTPIPRVQIVKRDGSEWCPPTNSEGRFVLTSESGAEFGLKKAGFETYWTLVPYDNGKFKFTLTRKIQDLGPVVITKKSSEKALDIKNYNIIAYQPLGDEILTLKHRGRKYYLGIDGIGEFDTLNIPWTKDRPVDFFFDCLSTPYVLTKDSAYQFTLRDEKLEILSSVDMMHFRSFIMPCVAAFDQGIVLNSFSDFNQTYDLVIHGKESEQNVYSFTDRDTYQAAWEAYAKLVGEGSNQSLTGDTITDEHLYQELRRKRREIYQRNDTGPDFERALKKQEMDFISSQIQSGVTSAEGQVAMSIPRGVFGRDYGASPEATNLGNFLMLSHPIRIQTYQLGNYMAVVNFEFDSVSIIDYTGAMLSKKAFEAPKKIEQVIQDKGTGHIYLYTNDGSHKIYLLNAFTGETTFVKDFGILKHAPDVKVYDHHLYYRMSDNQFYQVNRVVMPILKHLN
ncbi:MAG: hypothetical protein DCO96_14390 [Fluviicola sp. XM-24bin1]|nr:MAG: hypothetical protein DCO96_14390 [Fluviicola sp. XM-24bin1]